MTEIKENRRVRITKLAIKESLIELMLEYPLSKISVKMICDSADINRSTFYAHYQDQHDLLLQIQQEVIRDIKDQITNKSFTSQNEITIPVLVQIMEYAKSHMGLFRILIGENENTTFQNELMELAHAKMLEEIQEYQHLDGMPAKYIHTFAVSGCIGLLRCWLEDGASEDPYRVAVLITKLLFNGISQLYEA